MSRSALALLLCCLVVPSALSAAEPMLSWDAYGPIRFGSRLVELNEKVDFAVTRVGGAAGCKFVQLARFPRAIFMVRDGVVMRADVDKGVPNTFGVAVGADLATLRKRYPAMRVEPHRDDENGHYLIFDSPDRTRAIVLQETGGRVSGIRAGLQPSVEYVDRCL